MKEVDVKEINSNGFAALHVACCMGQEDIVKLLLACNKTDINQKDRFNTTPLLYACYYGNESLVSSLIQQKNIAINEPNSDGETPFSWACKSGFSGIAHLLLKHPDININPKNQENELILADSINNGQLEVTKLLIKQFGKNSDSIQPLKPFMFKNKKTCLMDLAKNYPEILELLNGIRNKKTKSARQIHDNQAISSDLSSNLPYEGGFFSSQKMFSSSSDLKSPNP